MLVIDRPNSKGNFIFVSWESIRDTPLNSNDIVITSKTMRKYSKIVDDSQYRVDFIVITNSL